MLNLQFLQIPVVTAVDVGQYIETLGMSLISSGLYEIPPYADDDFARYLTGFRQYVSGSGYWQGSGYAASTTLCSVQLFPGDTGVYMFRSITGAVLQSGQLGFFNVVTTGTVVSMQFFWGDTMNSYPTGFIPYPANTSPVFSFAPSGATAASTTSVSVNYLTGVYTSGYFSSQSGQSSALLNQVYTLNNAFSGVANSGYLSGFFTGVPEGYISTGFLSRYTSSGFSGYGSGLQCGGFDLNNGSYFFCSGAGASSSRLFTTGTIEIRFLRCNNAWINSTFAEPNVTPGSQRLYTSFANCAAPVRAIGQQTGIPNLKMTYCNPLLPHGGVPTMSDVQNNQWYTLSVTDRAFSENVSNSSGIVQLYLNGVLDNTGIISGGQTFFGCSNYSFPASPTMFVALGGGNAGCGNAGSFYGIIDEVRVWDHIRSSGQIYSGWNQTVNPQSPGLMVFFRL